MNDKKLNLGKLPNCILNKLLEKYKFEAPSVIIGPSVGEDIAAVSIFDQEILVFKSDPVTFTVDGIGNYAVLVNLNDLVTSGVYPRWLLTTLMFPCFTKVSEIDVVFKELYETCRRYGIVICGGHTEITDAVTRPIVIGTIFGVGLQDNLINKKSRMSTGDFVIMTKGIAIEGTVIIASRFKKLLLKKGMSRDQLYRCNRLKSKISILDEAKISWKNDGVSALHDITEGGIMTAINELSLVCGHKIRVYIDHIPVYSQTAEVCELLGIDPLGLIGSGSLLICCKKSAVNKLVDDMESSCIPAVVIGEILDDGVGIECVSSGKTCQLPKFDVDEIARLFQ